MRDQIIKDKLGASATNFLKSEMMMKFLCMDRQKARKSKNLSKGFKDLKCKCSESLSLRRETSLKKFKTIKGT